MTPEAHRLTRPRSENRFGGAIALALIVAAAAPLRLEAQAAAANATTVHAHVVVQPADTCVSYASLAERVRARIKRVVWGDDAAPGAPVLRVTIVARGARAFSAVLAVDWPGQRQAERQLNAGSCDAAADAL